MAVPEQTPYIEHTGNGVTTSFSLGFQCESKDHLIVLVDEIEPPIATWSLSGGNVVFTTAPAAGKKITLQRNTPFNRTAEYQSFNNSFRPQTVNVDFDRIWLKLQELGVADWLMKLYVDRLHQQQEQKINDLKGYVDDRDDELRAYLLEEIRKQGVALDQLDDYYNYLMQRLAQIAVDRGWMAEFVIDASGKTQQDINDRIGLEWREKLNGYELNARVMLANGDIVKNTINGNTTDPNVDIGVWSIVDHNNSDRFHPLDLNTHQHEISTNFAASLNALISKVSSSGGGTILIPDGDYTVLSGQAVSLKDNIELVLGRGANIKYARSGYGNYAVIEAVDVSNVKISGGVIDGNRAEHVVVGDPTKYWKMRTPSTAYVVGDYVYIHHVGYKVVTAGTTGAGLRPTLSSPTIGATLTDGTVVFEVYNTNVGEWGMGIDIRGSTGVTVEDVYVKNCWGDGVYIGRTENKAYSEDVTLTRVVTDFCRRQGVSIISVKGLKMDKLTAKDIRGTSPEGGIDFEPNNDDEFLLGISLTDYTATGCWGAGIHSFLGKFNSLTFEQDKVGITGINCRSIGNGGDLFMNGSTNALVKGTATFHNSTFADAVANYLHANPYGVRFENNHADSIQWSFYDCTFRRSANAGQANIRSTSVASLHGGLHLYHPTFSQVNTTYDATIMMNTTGAYKNISVVDPLTQPNTIPMRISGVCENLVISDNFNVWGYSQTSSGTYDFNRGVSVVDISEGVTLTVNTNQPFKNQRFRALNSATLAIGSSANIHNYPKPYSFSMRADDWIELSCNASGIWKVVGSSPTLNTFVSNQFTVPTQTIPASGKIALEFDFETAATGSALSFSYNVNLANLGVIANGYCLTAGKITLQLNNITASSVTVPEFSLIVTRLR